MLCERLFLARCSTRKRGLSPKCSSCDSKIGKWKPGENRYISRRCRYFSKISKLVDFGRNPIPDQLAAFLLLPCFPRLPIRCQSDPEAPKWRLQASQMAALGNHDGPKNNPTIKTTRSHAQTAEHQANIIRKQKKTMREQQKQ